uniref:Uncharacterized protein n=1 Tax=Phasianus colchicus TaxID=9054 RepID=A0A669QLX8_PHACC
TPGMGHPQPPCAAWRSLSDLILLLLIRQENKSPRQCLREGHCKGLQLTFFACKRSMVSARSSFDPRISYGIL